MKSLYPKENFSCYNYEKGQNAALEIIDRLEGETIERNLVDTELVFLTRGRMILSHGKNVELEVPAGKIMFFPPGSYVFAEFPEDSNLIICRVRGIVQLCECLSIETLYKEYGEMKGCGFHMLEINERIYEYIDHFVKCVNDGLRCSYYYVTKMKELFFLMRAYYSKDDLAAFFAPILSTDSQFMNLMYRNFRNVKSVQELVDISLYSPSGFKKQFNKVFGTSASEWLSDQRAALIRQELINSPQSIKEIAFSHGFSSASSFSSFCQNKFGMPPGRIRQESGRKAQR